MTSEDSEVVEWVKNPQGPGLVKKAAVAETTEKKDEAAIKKPRRLFSSVRSFATVLGALSAMLHWGSTRDLQRILRIRDLSSRKSSFVFPVELVTGLHWNFRQRLWNYS